MNPSDKQLRWIKRLHALMVGSPEAGEREAARTKLGELLERLKLSWHDLPQLLNTPERLNLLRGQLLLMTKTTKPMNVGRPEVHLIVFAGSWAPLLTFGPSTK